ncbi:hypothetical protein EB796_014714 [Bugula neritina]|uniref:Secreted protein n=1 Tax=Bugula neritina TaxID=10212 RepID=A0A7J7JNH9_BUGNE|nr:hypothetical protein EB796_014714 [Bugula neritina]
MKIHIHTMLMCILMKKFLLMQWKSKSICLIYTHTFKVFKRVPQILKITGIHHPCLTVLSLLRVTKYVCFKIQSEHNFYASVCR